MSDWRCVIASIERIQKHPKADNLSIATVLGDYPVIIKTDQFKVDELVCYISIDTIVPDTEQFYFLCPQNFEKYEEDNIIKQRPCGPKYPLGSIPENRRIVKAKRIRDVYSQGLLLPAIPGLNEGDSIVEPLNLKKWEEEEEDNIVNAKKTGGKGRTDSPPGQFLIMI